MADEKAPVTIKKYANRRLYNTGTSTYVTLEDLAVMVKSGEDFVVYDAKTSEDITRSVLAQIIFEQENKEGQNLLPITFLRQLIRFYGDSDADDGAALSRTVDVVADQPARQIPRADHPGVRRGVGGFGPMEDHVRRNMRNVRERLSPCSLRPSPAAASRTMASPTGDKPQSSGEMEELKRQLDEMQKRLDKLGGKE